MPQLALRSACAPLGVALAVAVLLTSSCIGSRVIYPVMPTAEELLEFTAAGPADIQTGVEFGSMNVAGAYRVVRGDLLSVELPPQVINDDSEDISTAATIKCRVKGSGEIQLPIVGDHPVLGKTLSEVEEGLAAAFNDPKRLSERPNVVVAVSEYHMTKVAVIGSVNAPGIHELRSDHMTVVGALMAAGGIKSDRGAREIKIISKDEQGLTVTRTLGVESSDIPLGDIALVGGETIVVESPPDRSFSVIGLVKKNGVFLYPAPRRYNLMQALATAGGVDETSAPRYATVYRVKADGSILGATFKIDGTSLTDASNVIIKDGDVIAVEHTQGSWFRQFFSQVFGFRASVNVTSSASPTL
jgi:protein involved in polysaccharide export with SLBB domain